MDVKFNEIVSKGAHCVILHSLRGWNRIKLAKKPCGIDGLKKNAYCTSQTKAPRKAIIIHIGAWL